MILPSASLGGRHPPPPTLPFVQIYACATYFKLLTFRFVTTQRHSPRRRHPAGPLPLQLAVGLGHPPDGGGAGRRPPPAAGPRPGGQDARQEGGDYRQRRAAETRAPGGRGPGGVQARVRAAAPAQEGGWAAGWAESPGAQ